MSHRHYQNLTKVVTGKDISAVQARPDHHRFLQSFTPFPSLSAVVAPAPLASQLAQELEATLPTPMGYKESADFWDFLGTSATWPSIQGPAIQILSETCNVLFAISVWSALVWATAVEEHRSDDWMPNNVISCCTPTKGTVVVLHRGRRDYIEIWSWIKLNLVE